MKKLIEELIKENEEVNRYINNRGEKEEFDNDDWENHGHDCGVIRANEFVIKRLKEIMQGKNHIGDDRGEDLNLNQRDRNELARLIESGNLSGLLSGESDDGDGHRLSWKLEYRKWTN